jgi:2'-5' RNA ligase
VRLFVGVALDSSAAAAIGDFVDALRRRTADAAPRARVTWVRQEQLHVTVRFIGNVDEAVAQAVSHALAPPIGVPPFDLEIGGTGTFPERGAPRVFWAGIASGTLSLAAAEREITGRLSGCGIDPESRPYHPHITLGRVKVPTGLRAAELLAGVTDRRFGASRVDAITLFQSVPSPKGHTYVALQPTPLAWRT